MFYARVIIWAIAMLSMCGVIIAAIVFPSVDARMAIGGFLGFGLVAAMSMPDSEDP